MLRIGKNPKDSGEAKRSAEKQEELAAPTEIETAASGGYYETERLVDPSGMPIRVAGAKYIAGDEEARAPANEYYIQSSVSSEEEVLALSIPRREFERLTVKTAEVLAEAALAEQRIGKDQEEIEQLKTETRALLAQLRAA